MILVFFFPSSVRSLVVFSLHFISFDIEIHFDFTINFRLFEVAEKEKCYKTKNKYLDSSRIGLLSRMLVVVVVVVRLPLRRIHLWTLCVSNATLIPLLQLNCFVFFKWDPLHSTVCILLQICMAFFVCVFVAAFHPLLASIFRHWEK